MTKSNVNASIEGTCIMFSRSVTVHEIFATQINCQKFDLKMKIKVEWRRREHEHAPFYLKWLILVIGDFYFRILANWQNMITQKVTDSHTRSDGCRLLL